MEQSELIVNQIASLRLTAGKFVRNNRLAGPSGTGI